MNIIYDKLAFIIGLIFAQLIVCTRFAERKLFWLRTVLSVSALIAIALLCPSFSFISSSTLRRWFIVLKYIVQFALSCVAVAICYKADIWSYLFCGVAAYCMQHIGYQFHTVVIQVIPVEVTVLSRALMLTACYTVVYIGVMLLIVRKRLKKGEPIKVDSKMQVVVTACVLIVTVFISFFGAVYSGRYAWEGANWMLVIICLFSIMTSVLGLMMEFGLFDIYKIENELEIVKKLLHLKQEQYKISKNSIELINIKCHDLRHQISALKGKVDINELNEISNAITIYDSMLHTGNEALDIVLTEKSLLCRNDKIKLTCLLNGRLLNDFADRDIYSIFGNAIENAIDGVKKIEEQKRIISITGTVTGIIMRIMIENYYTGTIGFENGLPVTIKRDKNYHGYGIKSIKYLVNKYKGDLSIAIYEDIFALNILLPVRHEEN